MKKYDNEDVIVAQATPNGVGAISVVRVSGPKSIEIVDSVFSGKKKLIDSPTHTIHYGNITGENGLLIDDVLVSVFRSPNSYTGEDSLEISTHGNPLIVEKLIGNLLRKGIRLAEPGEFTKRAFLNNRLDLIQAEAVADLINARTEASMRGARNQLDGLLSSKVDSLRNRLLNSSSLIELELDFAEEELEFIENSELRKAIEEIKSEITLLLRSFSFGRVIRDGVNVALVGKPNVGKSSLLNYLLKESRAIVSEIPGTTRDVIREDLNIDGFLFRLFDTAGLRLTEDKIEKEGVQRSRLAVKDADLVVLISDVETGFSKELFSELCTLTDEKRIIKLVNKIDIKHDPDLKADSYVSARTGEGIDKLLETLKSRAMGDSGYNEKTAIVTNIRHYYALKKAVEFLENAIISVSQRLSGEFIAVDLRNAIDSLSEIIGQLTSEDVLNNIFSRFCIGK
ncbi:MAG: tRNA uridine-5-carboxymethylaminomethyl(34) synthesis GTPase MnmE [Bacteroidota bacterium]|nr:tRNA uridine-5-carboxymethylaminomethyl(34) synthesis GTPase MnmE [Bacteroidota bacterium]MDP4195881.1 tRNA uridine-5-carboxymethylaminomethyl(34) synthesis GTPase MnmE [Bacteroidota bacterium]